MLERFIYPFLKFSDYVIPDDVFYTLQYLFLHLKDGYIPERPNIDNPKKYNEKILWLKKNFRNELGYIVTDKYKVRDYVKSKVGEKYLIPLIDTYENPDDIDFDKLPNKFVLKPNHCSGGVILCQDKNDLDEKSVKIELEQWLSMNYYYFGREWNYKEIRPRLILCEKYLNESDGKQASDYKVFCFNGDPVMIQFDNDRHNNHKRAFYDAEWNKLPFTVYYEKPDESAPFTVYYEKPDESAPKPKNFEKMLEIAKILSDGFKLCRVDLYNIDGEIYFGEITLHPGGGNKPFRPRKYDEIIGKKLQVK